MTRKKNGTKRKPPSELTERGGVALVEFHLARRGIESVRTQRNSDCGDIWANAPIGRISIEVKTTKSSNAWFMRRSQTGSEIYCLVHLESARCWVMTEDEIDRLLKNATDIYVGKIAGIKITDLAKEDLEAWHKIGAVKMGAVYRISRPGAASPQRSGRARADRIVKHHLADGTVKEYRYPR